MKWINNIWPLNWMCPGRLLGNNGIWPLMKINDDLIKLNGFREKLDDTRAWKHQSVFPLEMIQCNIKELRMLHGYSGKIKHPTPTIRH